MNTQELATKIYNYITTLNRNGEHWDKWDDEREIDFIRSLIDNQHKSVIEQNCNNDDWGF